MLWSCLVCTSMGCSHLKFGRLQQRRRKPSLTPKDKEEDGRNWRRKVATKNIKRNTPELSRNTERNRLNYWNPIQKKKKHNWLKKEEKKIAYVGRRAAENRQTFQNKRQLLVVDSPCKRRSSLSTAVNSAKKGLPCSPTKRKAVVRHLSEELNEKDILSNKKRLSALSNETRRGTLSKASMREMT